MVCANLDNQSLTPSKALTLCWFNTIAMNHIKIHALANWVVNLDATQNNPLLLRNSLVTVIYNHYGYYSFLTFFISGKDMPSLTKVGKRLPLDTPSMLESMKTSKHILILLIYITISACQIYRIGTPDLPEAFC